MTSPEFVKRFLLYNKGQSLRFEVYETNGKDSNNISLAAPVSVS